MEFGLFIQMYTPKHRRAEDPDAEHTALLHDLEAVIAADKAGFKYVWATEHHFLDEYSHLSANDVVLAYLARATERIHLGSGIFNPLPQVNHPAKVAETVAMLDHLSNGRFEFGTGRGAGTHEILGFLPEMRDLTHTREIWEDVIGEFPRMWLNEEYPGYQGTYWQQFFHELGELEFFDQTMLFAAGLLISLIPFLILVSSFASQKSALSNFSTLDWSR